MKKLLIFLVTLTIFTSCKPDNEPDTSNIYKWTIDVTYLNGDQETIDCQFKSSRDTEIKLLTDEEPCIVMKNFIDYEVVVCGVRKFNIVSKEIISIKEK